MKPDARTLWVLFLSCASSALLFAQAPGQQQPPEFVKQGQQLVREGKPDEALALYRNTLQTSPDSLPANIAAGSVLDLMGRGEEARKYFSKAIGVADTPEHKAGAQRAMAMSYAFEGNCDKTIEYEQQVFDYYGSVRNFFEQGEIADELARVCIDSGALDAAEKWYKIGHEMGLKEPELKPARQDLWNFRWSTRRRVLPPGEPTKRKLKSTWLRLRRSSTRGQSPNKRSSSPISRAMSPFTRGTTKQHCRS